MADSSVNEFSDESGLNESVLSNSGQNLLDYSQEEVETRPQGEEEQKEKLVKLPLSKVRTIVKTDPDVNLVNQEAIFLITKSTELFIDGLAKEAYKYTVQTKKKTLQKCDVENAIENIDVLVFLEGTLE